jgi:hypothetical protein
VPDIDLSPRERLTASGIDARDYKCESQWSAGPDQSISGIRADIGPMQTLVDEIRPFGLLRPDYAGESTGIRNSSPGVQAAREPQHARDPQQCHNFAAGKEMPYRGVFIRHGYSP